MNKSDARIENLKVLLKNGFSGDYAAKIVGLSVKEWNLARHDRVIKSIIQKKAAQKQWDAMTDKKITFQEYLEKRKAKKHDI